MVEAAGRVVEVLVGKQVDPDAAPRRIYFDNLGKKGHVKISVAVCK